MGRLSQRKLEIWLDAVKLPELFSIVEIEINHSCNLKCSYCPVSKFQRIEQGDMPENLFLKLIFQLKEISFKGKICFHFYNEPLLSPNLEKYVSLTKKHLPDCRIEIYTNGVLLTKLKIKKLISSGVDLISVTKHEKIRHHKLDQIYNELDNSEKFVVNYNDYTELQLNNRGGLLSHIGSRDIPDHLPCLLPSHMVTVTLAGNILPCYEDFFQKNSMGNINRQHILDIWNSSKFKKFRETLTKGKGRHEFEVCNKCNNSYVFPSRDGALFSELH